MSKQHVDAMRAAVMVIQRQTDVIDGASKLYDASPDKEAAVYRDMAHAALDALLDARRSQHWNLDQAMQHPDGENE